LALLRRIEYEKSGVRRFFLKEIVFMAAVVKAEVCEGCGDCVDSCPTGAIEIKESKAMIDTEQCADCAACVDSCPTHAIEME
jgi:ferredoxin